MAEMTAAEVVAWLTDDKAFGQECYSRKQIAQLIEQLAAEREKRESLEKQNKELFPYYQDHLEGALIPATEYQKWIKRAEQAEAQCAAYKKALDIAMSTNQSHETYCKVEAALEEKPQWVTKN